MDDFPYSARSDRPEMTEAQKILKEMMPSARPESTRLDTIRSDMSTARLEVSLVNGGWKCRHY